MVDFPIVELPAGRGILHRHVALEHQFTLCGDPLRPRLVVGMEDTVVATEVAAVVSHRHRRADAAAHTHRPVEVLAPVGAVATADVTHRTAVVALTQHRLAEAGGGLELVGQTAVAYHEAKLLRVGHRGGVGGGETGSTPAGGAAVGRIVYPARSLVVIAPHRSRVGRRAAAHRDVGDSRGHDGGVVLEIHHLLEAVGAIDIVGDGIIHCRVAIGVPVIAAGAAVDTGHHHGTVKERRVGKGVLLVHQRLLNLRRQLRQ